jgi:sensor histidine kinase YesM
MLNYVISEQRDPNWLFKSSYIYITENDRPLINSTSFVPNNSGNVIAYITDSKPYHTQVRDYTTVYNTQDVSAGTTQEELVVAVNNTTQWVEEQDATGDYTGFVWSDNTEWDQVTVASSTTVISLS